MDYRVFRAINQFAGRYRLLDMIMITISQKVRYLFVLILILMWFRNHYHKKITLFTGISVGITFLLNKIIKQFYFKPRPFLNLWVHLLPPSPSKRDSSFPSKHTTLAFAAATSVTFYKRVLGCIMYLLAFFAGFSRIWMGQHYPSDIICSALLGSLISVVVKITERVWNPVIKRFKHSILKNT
ncbi:undecaprenyl-diphosphatase [Bacillus sp. FJAT-29790]|uniref:undecaprenyl-diphosphatase n=1 Tax=Bacillus sp. FJAT-29790 TaxID=1895002 RepID=UPI001C24E8FE|nr:undecaprenyl-diphosphatase [Bacillus sp. FJAT-29790]MBU8880875.1 undecaprenyl-diphosphatase [Bacillus sp. FJAT-29790]